MSGKQVYLIVKDHSVSGEDFQLLYNDELEMLETFPIPPLEKLQEYYKSNKYISHTDTKRNLFENIYHLVRKISIKRKLKLINSFDLRGNRILDIGCGTGDFLEKARSNKWNVSGIEPNEGARNIANEKVPRAIIQSLDLIDFDKTKFDIITLWHVLEHLPNLEEQILMCNRLLDTNGRLIIAVPNYKSFDAKYYKSYWAAFDVPRHLWHFSKTSISKLMRNQNLIIEKILPMKFDAYYVSLLSEKYKSGWMNVFNALFIASRSNLNGMRTGEFSSMIYVLKKE